MSYKHVTFRSTAREKTLRGACQITDAIQDGESEARATLIVDHLRSSLNT